MWFKQLGQSGVHVPEVGMGTWNYHAGRDPLRRGIDAGAWFIDTAESYGTERVVAGAIEGIRDHVFIATKVSPAHFRRHQVVQAAERSLRQLGTDYVDLYQLHEPNAGIPLEETLAAMEDLVDAGKVRFVGVSNFSVAELQYAQKAMTRHAIVSNQVRYNLADRTIEGELLDYCAAHHITVIAYSPLAREMSRLADCDPKGILPEVAVSVGRTPAQVALNWCLSREPIVVIPKGNSVAHVLENCGASDWRLTEDQFRRLEVGIEHRRRSRFETRVRRLLPPPLSRSIQRFMHRLPAGWRRRFL